MRTISAFYVGRAKIPWPYVNMISQSYSIRMSTQSTNNSPLLFLDQTSRTIFRLLEVFKKPKLFLLVSTLGFTTNCAKPRWQTTGSRCRYRSSEPTHMVTSYSFSALAWSSISPAPAPPGAAHAAVVKMTQCAEQNPGRFCSDIASSSDNDRRTRNRTLSDEGGLQSTNDLS